MSIVSPTNESPVGETAKRGKHHQRLDRLRDQEQQRRMTIVALTLISSTVLLVGVATVGLFGAVQLIRRLVARRRRGRWGTLQDRFSALAARRGAEETGPNPGLANAWAGHDDASVAREVADRLDRAAFDPSFPDDEQTYAETRKLVGSLGHADR